MTSEHFKTLIQAEHTVFTLDLWHDFRAHLLPRLERTQLLFVILIPAFAAMALAQQSGAVIVLTLALCLNLWLQANIRAHLKVVEAHLREAHEQWDLHYIARFKEPL